MSPDFNTPVTGAPIAGLITAANLESFVGEKNMPQAGNIWSLWQEKTSPELRAFIMAFANTYKAEDPMSANYGIPTEENETIQYESLVMQQVIQQIIQGKNFVFFEKIQAKNLLATAIRIYAVNHANSSNLGAIYNAKIDMLVASLKGDYKAFAKAYKTFAQCMQEERPDIYAVELANAKYAYEVVKSANTSLSVAEVKEFFFNRSAEFKKAAINRIIQDKISCLDKAAIDCLDVQNDVKKNHERGEVFVKNAIKLKKADLKGKLPKARAAVKATQKAVKKVEASIELEKAKFVLADRIEQGCYGSYIWLWIKSCVSSLSAQYDEGSKQDLDKGSELFKIKEGINSSNLSLNKLKAKLKQEKDFLKSVKTAQKTMKASNGYIHGHYFTKALQNLLLEGEAKGSNMHEAISSKKTAEGAKEYYFGLEDQKPTGSGDLGHLIISNGSPSTVASLEEVTDLSKAVLVMPKSTVVKIEEDSESESEDEQDNSMNLSAVD